MEILSLQRKLSPEELKDRLDALSAIQGQIKQIQEKSEEGQKAMTLDTTIGFAETTSFAVKKAELAPASSSEMPGVFICYS